MLGAIFSGECNGFCAQEITCTSSSGMAAKPCIKASGAVPKKGSGRLYFRESSRLSTVNKAIFMTVGNRLTAVAQHFLIYLDMLARDHARMKPRLGVRFRVGRKGLRHRRLVEQPGHAVSHARRVQRVAK